MAITSAINIICLCYGITSSINYNISDITFSDTLLWIYKSLNPNIFSDLRKPGLVPGESLSLSIKIDSVIEKYLSYNDFFV